MTRRYPLAQRFEGLGLFVHSAQPDRVKVRPIGAAHQVADGPVKQGAQAGYKHRRIRYPHRRPLPRVHALEHGVQPIGGHGGVRVEIGRLCASAYDVRALFFQALVKQDLRLADVRCRLRRVCRYREIVQGHGVVVVVDLGRECPDDSVRIGGLRPRFAYLLQALRGIIKPALCQMHQSHAAQSALVVRRRLGYCLVFAQGLLVPVVGHQPRRPPDRAVYVHSHAAYAAAIKCGVGACPAVRALVFWQISGIACRRAFDGRLAANLFRSGRCLLDGARPSL